MEVNASPIMPPAEIQPSVQISVEHPNLATSIQYGISGLPFQVSNNPAPVRRRSALIIRNSSLSQHRLPPQKYKPTSDKPKVPFFMDNENISGVLRTEVIIIPRENLRDWVRPTSEFPLGADSSMNRMHDRDKGDKPNLEAEEMHLVNCGDKPN
ncbi:nuclear pore complex protein NUP98B-like isoform X3 [Solanum dulcamara]|nr:nuclear pore complex protein NUP98B-like isoform X3 [Solanum dulcamara]XP_055806254.1 nuclear pore complex protein NUP98B-like isoform X3 [Solanum dulcamara]